MARQELEIEHDTETGEIKVYRREGSFVGGVWGHDVHLVVRTDDLEAAVLAIRSILLSP